MKFETKAKLRERIKELEEQLIMEKHHTRRGALVDKADLPKCKSLACYKCEHIVTAVSPHGSLFLLGCGKDLDCESFAAIQDNLQTEDRKTLVQQGLTRQLLW